MFAPTLLLAARLVGPDPDGGWGPSPAEAALWQRTFPPAPASVTQARHAAVDALRSEGVAGPELDAAELVLGELISNAVVHAGTQFTVVAGRRGATAHVEVIDHDNHPPVLHDPEPDAVSGRGLRLVDGLAAAWGWEDSTSAAGGGRKRVWAEVRAGT
jgi:hypothetical protein